MLAYCAACRIGILHGCRVRISFAWFRSRSVADTNSLSRMSALLRGAGAICSQRVYHCRGDQLAGWKTVACAFPLQCQHCSSLERHMLGGSWGVGSSTRRIDDHTPDLCGRLCLLVARVMRLVEVLD